MKTWKHGTVAAIVAVVGIIVVVIACDDGSGGTNEEPKNQSATLINLFGEGLSATVQGNLTDTQWNGVADKIESALNSAFTAGNLPTKTAFINIFRTSNNAVIIVEKTTAYSTYKTVAGNKTTLYVNVDGLNNLLSTITTAIIAMDDGEAKIE